MLEGARISLIGSADSLEVLPFCSVAIENQFFPSTLSMLWILSYSNKFASYPTLFFIPLKTLCLTSLALLVIRFFKTASVQRNSDSVKTMMKQVDIT